MILSIVRFFNGGVSFEYLENVPLPRILSFNKIGEKIAKIEEREINRKVK